MTDQPMSPLGQFHFAEAKRHAEQYRAIVDTGKQVDGCSQCPSCGTFNVIPAEPLTTCGKCGTTYHNTEVVRP